MENHIKYDLSKCDIHPLNPRPNMMYARMLLSNAAKCNTKKRTPILYNCDDVQVIKSSRAWLHKPLKPIMMPAPATAAPAPSHAFGVMRGGEAPVDWGLLPVAVTEGRLILPPPVPTAPLDTAF
jgi:hypothetical protein